MATVRELQAGDRVDLAGYSDVHGVFIARAPHPAYQGLMLVVWKLSNGQWSFDALHEQQEIGEITKATGKDRGMLLYSVLHGEGPSTTMPAPPPEPPPGWTE